MRVNKNFWKNRLYNDNTRKRALYIYLPILLVLLANVAVEMFVTPKSNFLNPSQSFKDNIPVVYSPHYNISFRGLENLHPFDSKKYGRIYTELKQQKPDAVPRFITAAKPDAALLGLAHTAEYLETLQYARTIARITELGFLRVLPDKLANNLVLEPMKYQAGGSLQAALAALEHGWAVNLGGGFHHASSGNGEGFCPLADIGMIIKYLRREGKIKKAMIIDLDAHQGNGHETDFTGDEDVYILDIYNSEIYPHDTKAKRGIDQAVELRAFSGDKLYFGLLDQALPQAFTAFQPDIVIYIAGTDILDGDPLGALAISADGILKRDEMVFRQAFDHDVPVVMLLGGGYQKSNAHIIAQSILNLDRKFGLFSSAGKH
ncbi:MAG: histone deacetylase [Alphaproteobacteria bacterium]|nr:MAG: histone deacetylase [Alphaproteobacteria bacterium]